MVRDDLAVISIELGRRELRMGFARVLWEWWEGKGESEQAARIEERIDVVTVELVRVTC